MRKDSQNQRSLLRQSEHTARTRLTVQACYHTPESVGSVEHGGRYDQASQGVRLERWT